jgi:hypothetical protein
MTQNINLFHAGLRHVRPKLSFALLTRCVAGGAALILVLYALVQFQVSSLNRELRRVQEQLKAEQADALKVAGQRSASKPDPQLEAEIAKLQGELKQAQQTMSALNAGNFGDRKGFAQYLNAFSRQSIDGIWLTGFSITGGGDIEISGRTLRPDLVPVYIQRLTEEEVLAGRSFARLEMKRPETETTPDKKPAPLAPYLEFTLGTREAVTLVEKSQ